MVSIWVSLSFNAYLVFSFSAISSKFIRHNHCSITILTLVERHTINIDRKTKCPKVKGVISTDSVNTISIHKRVHLIM